MDKDYEKQEKEMYKNLYETCNNYIYELEDIYMLAEKKYSHLIFNSNYNYWMPLDEIGLEIYQKIKELNVLDDVKSYFCNKYQITEEVFWEDSHQLIENFVLRRFLEEKNQKKEKPAWMFRDVDLENINMYPFHDIYISLSDECNLDCIYCFNKDNRHKRIINKQLKKLSCEKIQDILKQFKDINGKRVVFTGGEPLLNKDFLALCEYAKEIGLEINFITNGLLLEEIDLERLLSCVDSFAISFDSIKEGELKELWNIDRERISEQLLESLRKIDAWAGGHGKKISINIMPIVSKINKDSLRELVCILYKNIHNCELKWSFTQYDKIEDEKVNERMCVTEEEYVQCVVESLPGSKENYPSILAYAHSHDNKLSPSREPKLISCAPSFFISNKGEIFPCQGCEREEYYLGNIWDIDLVQAYENEKFTNLRRKLFRNNIDKCSNCELKYACNLAARPCNETVSDNCKAQCVKQMYLSSMIN